MVVCEVKAGKLLSSDARNEKPRASECAGLPEASGNPQQLFSSFLRGASCLKSPRHLCQKRERLYLTTKRCCQMQLRSVRFADCPASVIKTVETYHLLTNNVSRSGRKRSSSGIRITIHLIPLLPATHFFPVLLVHNFPHPSLPCMRRLTKKP